MPSKKSLPVPIQLEGILGLILVELLQVLEKPLSPKEQHDLVRVIHNSKIEHDPQVQGAALKSLDVLFKHAPEGLRRGVLYQRFQTLRSQYQKNGVIATIGNTTTRKRKVAKQTGGAHQLGGSDSIILSSLDEATISRIVSSFPPATPVLIEILGDHNKIYIFWQIDSREEIEAGILTRRDTEYHLQLADGIEQVFPFKRNSADPQEALEWLQTLLSEARREHLEQQVMDLTHPPVLPTFTRPAQTLFQNYRNTANRNTANRNTANRNTLNANYRNIMADSISSTNRNANYRDTLANSLSTNSNTATTNYRYENAANYRAAGATPNRGLTKRNSFNRRAVANHTPVSAVTGQPYPFRQSHRPASRRG